MDVGEPAKVADRLLDRLRADAAVVRVLCELGAHRVGAGLRNPGLGDLDLGVRQVEDGAQLVEQCRFRWW